MSSVSNVDGMPTMVDIIEENNELKGKIDWMEIITSAQEVELSYLNAEANKVNSNLLKAQSEVDSASAKILQLQLQLDEQRLHSQKYIREKNESKTKEAKNNAEIVYNPELPNILKQRIQNLKSKLEETELSLNHLADDQKAFVQAILELKYEKQALEDERENLKEHVQQITVETQETTNNFKSIQEKKQSLKTELDDLKAVDTNAPRGNSFFGEIEEKRLKTAAEREVLKMKYINLKKSVRQKDVEINNLMLELGVGVQREEGDCERNIHQEYSNIIQTLKTRVSDLEEQLCSENPPVTNSEQEKCHGQGISAVVGIHKKEANALHEQLEINSSNYVNQGYELFEIQQHNRKIKATNLKLKYEIDELILTIKTLQSGKEDLDDGISPPVPDIIAEYKNQKAFKFSQALNK